MENEIMFDRWLVIDGSHGVEIFPLSYVSEEEAKEKYPGEIWEAAVVEGYGARLSMSGYMDCTDWVGPFATEDEAEEYLDEEYDDDE